MAVFRVEKNKNYTVMSNFHLRDRNLSLRSIALLSIMLSLPEDWDYSLRGLARICKDGRDAIGTALKELEKYGYLKREQKRDSHGRLSDIEYTVYEYPSYNSPCPENPDTVGPDTVNPDADLPDTAEPDTGNPPEENIDINNNIDKHITEKQSKELRNKESILLSIREVPDQNETPDGWTEGSYEQRAAIRAVLEEQVGYHFIEQKNQKLDQRMEEGTLSQIIYEMEHTDLDAVSYILDVMTDCISGNPKIPVKINGEDVPRASVRDRLMKVDKDRLLSVLSAVRTRGGLVRNKKAYIISALYNEGPPSLKGSW